MILELKTFLWAMAPIGELRLAIPIALNSYHLSVWSAYFISVLGNMVPVFFLLWLLKPLSGYLSHHSYFLNRFFAWLFENNRKRHEKRFEYWKELALIIFVAIPLPLTGAWTGSICAFLFKIPFKTALPSIFLGVAMAGLIMTLFTLGIINFI